MLSQKMLQMQTRMPLYLASVIESVPTHDNLLMLGDFNAVTGPRSAGYEDVVGPFGAGNPNNNSSRLLSLCSSHGLIVSGSWFRRLNALRWTWASNDGRTKKEIDHLITKVLPCLLRRRSPSQY